MNKKKEEYIRWFDEISMKDIGLVGGKNASLGEMCSGLSAKNILIPQGFAVTADAFSQLLQSGKLEKKIYTLLDRLDVKKVAELERTGKEIRSLIHQAGLPKQVAGEILAAYHALAKKLNREEVDVAVRSSATAEDLPEASFAGQLESFLNVQGDEQLLQSCLHCFASLFTDRAISYRVSKNFAHEKVRLSIGIQQMVRSDLGASGVAFTLDTESGARNVILINSAYGLGENIVGGRVDPDEFIVAKPLVSQAAVPILRRKVGGKHQRMVYENQGETKTKNIEVSLSDREKLSLSDAEVMQISKWAVEIESYYSQLKGRDTPMDIEWGKDGNTGKIYILQARPETVHSTTSKDFTTTYLIEKRSKVLLSGRAVGTKVGAGKVRVILGAADLASFQDGEVLVTDMTSPDWEPIMKKASAIVTNRGGRTCHAAIVSREHGVPCLVGTGKATELLQQQQEVTVSCAEGDEGFVYSGIIPYRKEQIDWKKQRSPKTKIMVNLGNPAQALKASLLPVSGVGLVRIEFIISEFIKIHPMALAHWDEVKDEVERKKICSILASESDLPEEFFIRRLAEGIGMIAGAFYPRPVIVRFSDFKSNEYRSLLGGRQFEPNEENPMIGFRGAARYYSPLYRDGFALECQAINYLRNEMGLKNVKLMIPFCRSPDEGKKVLAEMEKWGLQRGKDGLEVYVMSELPTNVLRANDFAQTFDGFSIGSNDLTQMVLGVDRDSSEVSELFDERDPSVMLMISMAIRAAKFSQRPIGICGQAPSDYIEILKLLVREKIDSISVTPDVVFKTIRTVSSEERSVRKSNIENDKVRSNIKAPVNF